MTQRHAGYVVTLEQDMREDDAQVIFDAILLLRGVAGVSPVVGGIEQTISDQRARAELWAKLRKLARLEEA